ncbi:peptidase, S9A/B/C family, catalytic domain protein [Oesophagostomum dentatum]|uniref:Peptidase, S9A/B/C family, catalytic domain protein n=1 Tax=Oesophagostomum dentatum TaxID=61180 RepID=A0A0B1T478_OESDE|nr:peptidase, S9A/B/C family, catalytic domain protein [Oesophagostomum dentatum]
MKQIEPLFNLRSELKRYKLNKQVGFEFKTRDGMTLQAYISLPPDAALRTVLDVSDADKDYAKLGMLPVTPQKMVVTVHGGPTTRDIYAFNPQNAWLTNRGYAVLQVNYRGSGGFGKQMINAGNGEWGRKMHFDILDAVEFALAKGIANKTQIAIMGSSFGGYEVLVALTSSPHVFACGIDIFGPSNLVTFARTIPPYWTTSYLDFIRKIGGNPDTAEGRRSLEARSPLFSAERIIKPLMILHGANDTSRLMAFILAEQFVKALQRRSIPVTYILYPDEGHGFVKVKANGFALESSFSAKQSHVQRQATRIRLVKSQYIDLRFIWDV